MTETGPELCDVTTGAGWTCAIQRGHVGQHRNSDGELLPLQGDSRWARVSELTAGDFIEIHDGYGEVTMIRGPHGPLGTPPSTDWYTLRVQYEDERHKIYGVIPKHPATVGPLKGDREVVCWS